MPHRPAREPRRQQIMARPILFDGGINLLDPAQVAANQHVAGRNWFRGEDMVIRPRPGNLPWDPVTGAPLAPSGTPPVFSPNGIVWGSVVAQWTADSGATWAAVTGLVPEGDPDLWAVSTVLWYASHPGAVTNPRKIRKSADGQTFVVHGNDTHSVRKPRAICRLPSGRIVCGLTSEVAPDDKLAVAYSDDDGTSWTIATVDATLATTPRTTQILPISGTIVMLIARLNDGVDREQLFRSTDSGVTWARVGPVCSFTLGQFMDFIWKDPTSGFLFSPRTRQAASEYVLFRSTDLGASFSQVDSGAEKTGDLNSPVRSQIARWEGKLIWSNGAGSLKARQSSDNGAIWTAYTGPDTNIGGCYRMNGALIAARDAGSTNDGWRSVDEGVSWVGMPGIRGPFTTFASPVTGGA